jgi:hypothetical protein
LGDGSLLLLLLGLLTFLFGLLLVGCLGLCLSDVDLFLFLAGLGLFLFQLGLLFSFLGCGGCLVLRDLVLEGLEFGRFRLQLLASLCCCRIGCSFSRCEFFT